jgi:hypothetical protein
MGCARLSQAHHSGLPASGQGELLVRSCAVADDPERWAVRKPDGIDFVEKRQISSFPQKPAPMAR